MAIIDEELENLVAEESFFDELTHIDHELGKAMMAVLSFPVSDKIVTWVEDQYHDKAKVQGRSATLPDGIAEGAAPVSRMQRVRPNGEVYYCRKWNGMWDVEVLEKAREIKQYILTYGEPGTGKTAMLEAAFGQVHEVMGSNSILADDFIGGFTPQPGGGFKWNDGPLLKAMENGEVLFVDEIGLIDTKELSVLYSVMDGRDEIPVTQNPERGTVKAKEGFYVVAATNPNAPGVRLSEALMSRFLVQVEITTDWTIAREVLGVPFKFVAWAKNTAKAATDGLYSWSPQMREAIAFKTLSDTFGEEFAIANMLAIVPKNDREQITESFNQSMGTEIFPARL